MPTPSPDIVMFVKPGIVVDVHEGDPPADQSALVAQLTADLATRTSERDAAVTLATDRRTAIDGMLADIADAEAADAAEQAADSAGDAARAKAKTKGQAAP